MEITKGRMFWILAIVMTATILFVMLSPFEFYTRKSTMVTCTCLTRSQSCPTGAQISQENFIIKRLDEAETIWKNGVADRHQTEKNYPGSVASPWSGYGLILLWDFFYPTYNCPHLIERLGRVGDGGKWTCGISHLAGRSKTCLVYSYGIAGDTSFEQDILRRTNCTLRGFDHTVSSARALQNHPGRSSFDKIGLGAKDDEHIHIRTLKSEMTKHGDKFIDILKLDVEGGEFDIFRQILQDFPDQLPFGQLLIELHVGGQTYAEFKSWWEALENAGLRAFSSEPNLHILRMGVKDPNCYEFAFLNVKTDHVLLHG